MCKAILTIDDVSSKNTPQIVDFLKEKKIPVILFAVGQNLEKYPDEAVYAIQNGAVVGNHSYSHPAFSSLSTEEGIVEIEKTEELLNRLYEEAGVCRKYRPFRFPYGDKGSEKKEAFQQYLKKSGFHKVVDRQITGKWYADRKLYQDIDTFWTFDFGEWQIRPGEKFGKEDVLQRMHDTNPGYGEVFFKEGAHHMLLLHAHDETEAMVPGYYRIFIEEALRGGMVFEEPKFEQI